MEVLSVDGRPWERVAGVGVGNEGAGGGHAFRCYYHKANFKLNTAECNYWSNIHLNIKSFVKSHEG